MRLFGTKPPKNQGFTLNKHQNERPEEAGSVIIWILIMVALFAALNYTVSKNSRSGTSVMTGKQAELAASEILDYASAIKRAVQELQINGCADTEISFENNVVAGYTNANAPSDNSCHIFHPNGGGLQYVEPNRDWLDNDQSSQTYFNEWYTTPSIWIVGIGTDGSGSFCNGGAADGSCRELLTGVPYVSQQVCMALNKKLGWGKDNQGSPIKDSGIGYGHGLHARFSGSYGSGNQMGTANPGTDNFSSIYSGCIEGDIEPAAGTYHFFHVLIAR